jgi:hypothetical protein
MSVNFAKKINETVELVFIDGAHDYQSVSDDFAAWYPKVIDGGVMAFHDSYAGGDPYRLLRKVAYTGHERCWVTHVKKSRDSICRFIFKEDC